MNQNKSDQKINESGSPTIFERAIAIGALTLATFGAPGLMYYDMTHPEERIYIQDIHLLDRKCMRVELHPLSLFN